MSINELLYFLIIHHSNKAFVVDITWMIQFDSMTSALLSMSKLQYNNNNSWRHENTRRHSIPQNKSLDDVIKLSRVKSPAQWSVKMSNFQRQSTSQRITSKTICSSYLLPIACRRGSRVWIIQSFLRSWQQINRMGIHHIIDVLRCRLPSKKHAQNSSSRFKFSNEKRSTAFDVGYD